MSPLMTASEVAAHLRCSTRTVNRMAQTRQLPALKRGKHWRFSPDAIAAYEAANTTEQAMAPRKIGYREPAVAVIVSPSYQPGEMDGELPPRWWESEQNVAASPAAGRGRTSDTKRRTSVSS